MRRAIQPTQSANADHRSATSLLAGGGARRGGGAVWGKPTSCEAFLVEPPGGPPVI
jgi:hypothetical protein